MQLVFPNGVTLRFVESTIASGQATLSAASAGGWSLLPEGSAGISQVATAAVSASGLAEHDQVSLQRFLDANSASLAPFIDETEEGFVGGASAADLETLFQLLHLSVTEPRVDSPALRSEVEAARETVNAVETDPGLALDVALHDLRFGGAESQRLLPTEEELDDLTEASALDLYTERLGKVDDLVVAVVGDVDRESVLDLARSYLGSLPSGPADTWEDVQPPAPDGVVSETLEIGAASSAGAVALLHTSEGTTNADLRVATELTAIILNGRLFDSLRESLGVTYGGQVSLHVQALPSGLVEALTLIEGDPARLGEIHDAVLAELADLASNGPGSDEMEQARAILEQDYGLINNGTALELLLSPERRPGEEVLDLDLRVEILEQLTAEDVGALAATLYPDDRRIELFRVPEQ